jgi:hypothetical protein
MLRSEESKQKLLTKARLASAEVLRISGDATNRLMQVFDAEENPAEEGDIFPQLSLESLIYSLHLTDRFANGYMKGDRAWFMDLLLAVTVDELGEEAQPSFGEMYNARQQMYGAARTLFPSDEAEVRDSLMWIFSRLMTAIFSEKETMDRITSVSEVAGDVVVELTATFKRVGLFI